MVNRYETDNTLATITYYRYHCATKMLLLIVYLVNIEQMTVEILPQQLPVFKELTLSQCVKLLIIRKEYRPSQECHNNDTFTIFVLYVT